MTERSRHPVLARARAWLDPDGVHIWISHDCPSERVTFLLPHPPWGVVEREGDTWVDPSVHCTACGLHAFLRIEKNPEEPS